MIVYNYLGISFSFSFVFLPIFILFLWCFLFLFKSILHIMCCNKRSKKSMRHVLLYCLYCDRYFLRQLLYNDPPSMWLYIIRKRYKIMIDKLFNLQKNYSMTRSVILPELHSQTVQNKVTYEKNLKNG